MIWFMRNNIEYTLAFLGYLAVFQSPMIQAITFSTDETLFDVDSIDTRASGIFLRRGAVLATPWRDKQTEG